MAASTSHTSRITRFDGSNYLAWRNRVFTELLCEDLAEFVEQKPTEEQKKKKFGTEKHPISWVQGDARARRIIVDNLADSLLHYAPMDAASSFDVWKKLKATYNRSSYLQHAYLRRKLSNLLYDSKSDLANFFRDFDDIIAEIRSGGGKLGKIEDVETVVLLLAALPSDYSPLVASFGEVKENSLLTLEGVKGALLDYDLKKKDERKLKKSDIVEKVDTAYHTDSCHESVCFSSSNKPRENRGDVARSETVHCTYCRRDGHRENRCFRKKNEKKRQGDSAHLTSGDSSTAPRAVAWLTESNQESRSILTKPVAVDSTFVSDSGCTRFMVKDRDMFSSCQPLEEAVPVTLADDSVTTATHGGTVNVVSNLGVHITFSDVLYVPKLRRNLLSVRKITARGYKVVFTQNGVEIGDRNGALVATGYVENDLFFIDFSVIAATRDVAEANVTYEQLHRRLGHPGEGVLTSMKRNGFVEFQGNSSRACESCIQGKQCQLPYPTSTFETHRALEQVVSDVCVCKQASREGYQYFVTFLDVYTHFSVVFLLKQSQFVSHETSYSTNLASTRTLSLEPIHLYIRAH